MSKSFLKMCVAVVVLALCPTEFSSQASAMAPSKGRPKPVHALKVMVRHPGPVFTRYPSKATAVSASHLLKRAGWNVKVRTVRGAFITEARMPRWKQYGIYTNVGFAQQAAYTAKMQGFQVNVVKVH